MNSKTALITIWIGIFTILFPVFSTLAEELDSTNYKILDVTTQGGGTAESENFSTLMTINDAVVDPSLYSTNYKLYGDPADAFRPAVPTVSCFEATTNGSSSCTTGPGELPSGGMVALCGSGGCYDKARFEINTNDNPADTLYAVEISTDSFVADSKYIDGSTNEPKSDLTLNDFRTKTAWESDTFNILGLQESTEYDLRIIALHGDFTQTEEGPPATATTGQALCSFDLDIADETGTTAETDPPFNITFTGDNALLAGAGTVFADNLVWMDAETNGSGGFAIVQRGENGGLYSTTLAAQINSVTGDLDALTEGFGLQSYYIDHATGTGLGTITAETNYSGSVSNVGIVDTDWNKVYDSSGPTVTGRMALYVMARAGSDKQGATDYQESISFILVPRY